MIVRSRPHGGGGPRTIEPETDRVGVSVARPGSAASRPSSGPLRPAARARPRPGRIRLRSPRSSRTWALPGYRWSLGRAARLVRVHGLRGFQHGDRPAPTTSGWGAGRHARRGNRSRDQAKVARKGLSHARALTAQRRPRGRERPFDAERDGFVMGEAPAPSSSSRSLSMEEADAKIYASSAATASPPTRSTLLPSRIRPGSTPLAPRQGC